MAGLRFLLPMPHPRCYHRQRTVRGQSDWLGLLCRTLSFPIPSRFNPALSPSPFNSAFLEPGVETATSLLDWDILYGGYRYDDETGLYGDAGQTYHYGLGRPLEYGFAGNLPESVLNSRIASVPQVRGRVPVFDPSVYDGQVRITELNAVQEYLVDASYTELVLLTAAFSTVTVFTGGLAAYVAAGAVVGGGLLAAGAGLAAAGAVGGVESYAFFGTLQGEDLTVSGAAQSAAIGAGVGLALGPVGFVAGKVASPILRSTINVGRAGLNRAVGPAARAVRARIGSAFGSRGGRGLINLVKAGGTIDDSLQAPYVSIARSAKLTRDLNRYNLLARIFRVRPAASADDIVAALESQVTFARTSNLRAGLFAPGEHSGSTRFWIQGNPATRYGRRVGRHELTHLGAALRGQGDTYRHEFAVQLATTPEIAALKAAIFGGSVYAIGNEIRQWIR